MTIDGYIINVKGRIGISQDLPCDGGRYPCCSPSWRRLAKAVTSTSSPTPSIPRPRASTSSAPGAHELFDGNSDGDPRLQLQQVEGDEVRPGRDQHLTRESTSRTSRRTIARHSRAIMFTVRGRSTRARIITAGGATKTTIRQQEAADYICGQKFGAKFTTDVDLSYTFMQHFTLTVGANNIFNTHPDKISEHGGQPDLCADRQHRRRPGLSAPRRSVRDQRRLLVRPARG